MPRISIFWGLLRDFWDLLFFSFLFFFFSPGIEIEARILLDFGYKSHCSRMFAQAQKEDILRSNC